MNYTAEPQIPNAQLWPPPRNLCSDLEGALAMAVRLVPPDPAVVLVLAGPEEAPGVPQLEAHPRPVPGDPVAGCCGVEAFFEFFQ